MQLTNDGRSVRQETVEFLGLLVPLFKAVVFGVLGLIVFAVAALVLVYAATAIAWVLHLFLF